MEIDFEAETPEGLVNFKGSLTKDEVSFLLRYALLSLLTQGMLPQMSQVEDEDIPPTKLN
jgi:hypothetical protein